jgi:hypothetical protein
MPSNEKQRDNRNILREGWSHLSRFSALEYRAQGGAIAAPVILLVLDDAKGNLLFFVNPDWREIVEEADISYLESLFQDFIERSKLHPDALFKQLSGLGVGSLVTQRVGEDISAHSGLRELLSRFDQL